MLPMTPQHAFTPVLLVLQTGLPASVEAQESPNDLLRMVTELDEQAFGAFSDRGAERSLTFSQLENQAHPELRSKNTRSTTLLIRSVCEPSQ